MRFCRSIYVLAFLLATIVPSFAHHLAVVVDKDNKVDQVSSAHLAKIFRSEVTRWPDGKSIVLVLHRNSSGEIETLQHVSKMSVVDLKTHIAAHQDSIKIVDSDDDLLQQVESTPGAIGLVDVRSINDAVKVVKVDGKLPLESGYLPH